MHIHTARFLSFKRFVNLTITELPPPTRLVLLSGPNGLGKSSVFDGFRVWQHFNGLGGNWEEAYHHKQGAPLIANWPEHVQVSFHESAPTGEDSKRIFYIRSAYRHEADFTVTGIGRMNPTRDAPRVNRMIELDTKVAENYQRIVARTVESIYGGQSDSETVGELRESLIGDIRRSMLKLFPDLSLTGPGDPLQNGTFYFDKAGKGEFHYKNLSGGEKAAFDIVLDLIAKKGYFNDTVYCIDEPELHLNTRVQARLLEEMLSLMPPSCQLWVATHSIGMMRAARDLQAQHPSEVVFLDFEAKDFESDVIVTPQKVTRDFWARTLRTAFDEMASLLAPQRLVLCEGSPGAGRRSDKAEFDASCYRSIFSDEYPDTDFMSVGNAADVSSDRLGVGRAVQAIVPGTQVLRLIDRDDRSEQEILELHREGVRVLGRRHIEAYLLDDEILSRLCEKLGCADRLVEVLAAKQARLAGSVQRGHATDDIKSAAGELYVDLKRILSLTQVGNNSEAFLRDTVAPLVSHDSNVYRELRRDIFNE